MILTLATLFLAACGTTVLFAVLFYGAIQKVIDQRRQHGLLLAIIEDLKRVRTKADAGHRRNVAALAGVRGMVTRDEVVEVLVGGRWVDATNARWN